MAVIKEIPGLEVTVEVDGRKAKEYVDPDAVEIDEDDNNNNDDLHNAEPGRPRPHVVKYIEAKPGAAFQFRLKRTPDFKHLGDSIFFKAIVDGGKDNSAHNDHSTGKHSTFREKIDCFYSHDSDGNSKAWGFKFGDLNVGEMDSLTKAELKKQAEKAKDLGILKVQCFHSGQPYLQSRRTVMAAPSHIDGVSEKALKGKSLDCHATFESKPAGRSSGAVIPYLDSKQRPFAIFEFRYRSKKGLIDEGIIPRPAPGDVVDDMSDDEVRRLARELLSKQEKANGTKHEDKKRGIKREGEPMDDAAFGQRYKTHRSIDGHLEIDLTGDD